MSTASESRTSRKRLDLGCAGIRLTAREFDAIRYSDLRFRYELIGGIVVVSRLPSIGERDSNEQLGAWLRTYEETHPDSTLNLTMSECYVRIGEHRRRADRLIWAGLGRLADPEHDLPTIAVEFVSKSKRDWLRDYEEKRVEYLGRGIAEYWVIDRFARTMTVYKGQPAEPVEQVLDAAATYRTMILPGFELSLPRLFARAALWMGPKPRRG